MGVGGDLVDVASALAEAEGEAELVDVEVAGGFEVGGGEESDGV